MIAAVTNGEFDKVYETMSLIDISKAEASVVKDKENIMAMVQREGGEESLNNTVRKILREWIHETIEVTIEEIKSTSENPTNNGRLARSYYKVGEIYIKEGLYDKALDYFEKCRNIEQVLSKKDKMDHLDSAKTLSYIGLAHDELGNYDTALTFYDECRIIQESELGSNNLTIATTCNNIATAYLHLGRFDKALEILQQCRVIQSRSLVTMI